MVSDVSFQVQAGEVVGLLGPNGSGKTTTMKMLTAYLPPSSGQAFICGLPLSEGLAVRRHLGYLPEHAPVYDALCVDDHLAFMGGMHGLSADVLHERMDEMRNVCDLQSMRYRRIETLSKGYRQRVALAASLIHDPDCLILDEPTTGLDPNQLVDIRRLIRQLGEHKAVLLSSHVLSEIELLCDRVLILHQGHLKAEGRVADLLLQAEAQACIRLRCRHLDALQAAIQQAMPHLRLQRDQHALLVYGDEDAEDLAEQLFALAAQAELALLELRAVHRSLEDVFHRLTESEA